MRINSLRIRIRKQNLCARLLRTSVESSKSPNLSVLYKVWLLSVFCSHSAYDCSMGGFNRGTLYVSQNYVCFPGKKGFRLPYTKVLGVTYEPGALGDKLNIKDETKTVCTME